MYIKKLQLQNFKRFTDLTIDLTPDSPNEQVPKLVLLIGANGSGKSSIFDGFELANNFFKHNWSTGASGSVVYSYTIDYYNKKDYNYNINFDFSQNKYFYTNIDQHNQTLTVNTNISELPKNGFYGRTAFTYIPQVNITHIGGDITDITLDEDRASAYFLEDKERFNNDVSRNIGEIINNIFTNPELAGQISKDLITKINESLSRIFYKNEEITKLKFVNVDTPRDGNPLRFWFKKGESNIDYNRLSAGEKMVFVFLYNLYVRTKHFNDTIYFFDELDLHLNTSLQYDLLKEVTEYWIPDNSQIWVASHSLGFIEYAMNNEDSVVIDFDNLNFDEEQTLKPKQKDIDVYDIAIPKATLSTILKGKKIIFCENTDDEYYNNSGLTDTLFIGSKDKFEVLARCKKEHFGIVDRDYMEDSEFDIIKKTYPNLFILSYYTFENYLYHPENIWEIDSNFDVKSYKQQILEAKNKALLDIEINSARKTIPIVKEISTKIREKTAQKIKEDLCSEDFETYYKYFNMKTYFSNKPNISKEKLSQTTWFKNQIQNIINS
jgi:AAA domain, putative AbiEii toxin, Type IV TA system